jgi:plastocyanin
MSVARLLLPVAVAATALALAGCGGSGDDGAATTGQTTEVATAGETLSGTVGPGFTIALDEADGIAAGTYTIVVDDRSSSHNFHLSGPGGVDVATSVGGEGEESFEVDLEPGEYTFLCDPHASAMRGTFTVS